MSVVDREALKEALKWSEGEEHRMSGPTRTIVAAARSVLEGEAIWWCDFHKNKMATAGSCFSGLHYGALNGVCPKVRVVVVPIEEKP